MGISTGNEILGGFSIQDETLGGISIGDEIIWQLGRLGSMFFNIKNPAFAHYSSDTTLTGTWHDLTGIAIDYTPTDANAQVGILPTMCTTSASTAIYRVSRGSTVVSPQIELPGTQFHRQLMFDEPGGTSEVNYKIEGNRANTIYRKGTSLLLFEVDLQDNQALDVVTSDVSYSGGTNWTDVASVNITPPSTSSKVYIRNTMFSGSVSELRLMRDSTEVISIPSGCNPTLTLVFENDYPSNFEDFVDSPNTTSEVTYKIQCRRTTAADIIYKGSFLFASVLPD